MRPLTPESAKKMAMATGGSLVVDGARFNASRSVVDISSAPGAKAKERAPEPTPLPPPQPAVAPASQEAIEKMAAATFTLADANARLVDGIKAHLEATAKPEAPARSWKFTINRDKVTGLMTSIDAKAIT